MLLLLFVATFIGYAIGRHKYKYKLSEYDSMLSDKKSTIDRYKIKINHLLGINQEQQNEIGKLLDLKSETDDKITTQRIVINGLNDDVDQSKVKLKTKEDEIKSLLYRISQFEKNLKNIQ